MHVCACVFTCMHVCVRVYMCVCMCVAVIAGASGFHHKRKIVARLHGARERGAGRGCRAGRWMAVPVCARRGRVGRSREEIGGVCSFV